ncbi:hypothetical protein [Streptomyces sp. NPDC000658]|uniref:hypothetical protein n=1 Tax=Streptomyces sp. NPDC000658 TaxID=3154266 RepID=UPI003327ADF1
MRYVLDTRTGRIGEVMERSEGAVVLRPVGGGREWDCPPEDVGEVSADEVLRERVRRLNRDARSGVAPVRGEMPETRAARGRDHRGGAAGEEWGGGPEAFRGERT